MVQYDYRRINNAYATVNKINLIPATTGNDYIDGIIKWTQQYGPLSMVAGVGTLGVAYIISKIKAGGIIGSLLSMGLFIASLPLIGFGGYSIVTNAMNNNRSIG